MQRAARIAYWAIPSLFCLYIYKYGFMAWFQQDDFAWLGLHQMVHNTGDLIRLLFAPLAQGTIRPLSERVFFMSLTSIFGMDALPFRLVIFGTMFFDLVILCMLMNRLAGSRVAGFASALLFAANSSLAIPLSWASAYNQILCSGFLLLATYLFVRYAETGEKRYYWGQWLVFLLGFGVLEVNVVYPALAALYALCCARRYFKSTLPMFLASIAFTIAHRAAAGPQRTTIYQLFFDSSIFKTLWTYVRWVIGGTRIALAVGENPWPFYVGEAIAGVGLLLAIVWALRKRQWIVLFFLGWFLGVLAPVLPLRNHITEYYLVAPCVGLAMLGGWAIAMAWRSPNAAIKSFTLLAMVAYLEPSAWAGRKQSRYNYESARHVKAFVQRVAYAHKIHPNKILLIRGMTDPLFWTGFYGDPFRLFGLKEIYLTAETQSTIRSIPDMGDMSRYFLPEAAAYEALKRDEIVVYEFNDDKLKNVTPLYTQLLTSRPQVELPARVELGQEIYARQLGDGWYGIENRFRWMSKRGVVKIRGPQAGEQLEVVGGYPEEQLAKAPLRFTVTANGKVIGTSEIRAPNNTFKFRYPLPPELIGQPAMEVAIEVDHTFSTAADDRKLGAVITSVALVR